MRLSLELTPDSVEQLASYLNACDIAAVPSNPASDLATRLVNQAVTLHHHRTPAALAVFDRDYAAFVKPALRTNPRPVLNGDEVEHIVSIVASHFDIALAEILGRSRTDRVAWARSVAAYLIIKLTRWPMARVGKLFNRDRTTVLCACRRVEGRSSVDLQFAADLALLNTKLSTICSSQNPR